MSTSTIYLGTAGWTIPKTSVERFSTEGSHLLRYASRLPAVEVNSTFRQWHQPATFARWAATVPEGFRFALKVPQSITHEAGLAKCDEPLARFLHDTAALGGKRGPLLVQLPPSLGFSRPIAAGFFSLLRQAYAGPVVCEPRHPSWFTPAVEGMLVEHRIARAAADPPPVPAAGNPGGWRDLAYYRWHGSPRIYYSEYDASALQELSQRLIASAASAETWCIFDNTALGFATTNALEMARLLGAAGFNLSFGY